MLDPVTALRVQLEWGADEAIAETPLDRFAVPARDRLPPAPDIVAVGAQAKPRTATVAAAQIAAGTISELMAEWDAVPDCRLRDTATRTVPPAGKIGAELMLLAEAPSAEDDRAGAAFSGAAGSVLDRVMGSIGRSREGMMLGFISPWRPPGGRVLSASEVQMCLPFVQRLLFLARPRLLILAGGVPAQALAGETARRGRGRLHEVGLIHQQVVVPAVIFPPVEQWLSGAAAKQRLWSDLIFLQRATTTA